MSSHGGKDDKDVGEVLQVYSHFDHLVESLSVPAENASPTGQLKQPVCQGAIVKLQNTKAS